jgi:hypothetical protein
MWRFHDDFVEVKYMTRGPIVRNIVYYVHLHILCLTMTTPFTCVSISLVDDTYIVGPISNGSYFLKITKRIFNIKAFNVANKVCNLFSTRVGPFYITSS